MSWYCDIGCVVEIPPPRYASKDSKDAEKKFYRRAQAKPTRIPGSSGTHCSYDVIICSDCGNAFDDVCREMTIWKRIVEIDNELNAVHSSRVVSSVLDLKVIHAERNVLLQNLADEAKVFFEKRKLEVTEANKEKSPSDWL